LTRTLRPCLTAAPQIALHVPQRDGEHRVGVQLDDAERRRRELGQRRPYRRRHFQREGAGVGERPAGGVLRSRGTSIVKAAFSGSGAENVTLAHLVAAFVLVEHGLQRRTGGRDAVPTCSAAFLATGAENRSTIDERAGNAAFERSRSQLNSA
jgi:hypothetical protein